MALGQAETALRAYLVGDTDAFNQIVADFGPDEKRRHGILIGAAFFTAADRRFAKADKPTEIVEFVSELRSRSGRVADRLDPRVAERLLLSAVADEDIDDIAGEVQSRHYGLLLAGMVTEAKLSETELDDFLIEASTLADRWLEDD